MKIQNILVICVIVLLGSACEKEFLLGCLDTEGEVETRVIDFGTFDDLIVEVDSEVTIIEGSETKIEITAHTNVIDRIVDDSRVRGDELSLNVNGCSTVRTREIEIEITMPFFEQIKINGDAIMASQGLLSNFSDLKLEISGDGKMDMELGTAEKLECILKGDGEIVVSGFAELLKVDISGDGLVVAEEVESVQGEIKTSGDGKAFMRVTEGLKVDMSGDGFSAVSGTASTQEIKLSGDCEVRNFDLVSNVTEIDVSGDGDIEVNVIELLDVKLSGDGKVCYKGNPTIEIKISGDGELTNCN